MIRLRQILPAGPALVLLAACGKPVFDRDPELSPIGVDRRDLAAAQTVNVPMPPPEMPRIPDRAERASLWEPGSGGFFDTEFWYASRDSLCHASRLLNFIKQLGSMLS